MPFCMNSLVGLLENWNSIKFSLRSCIGPFTHLDVSVLSGTQWPETWDSDSPAKDQKPALTQIESSTQFLWPMVFPYPVIHMFAPNQRFYFLLRFWLKKNGLTRSNDKNKIWYWEHYIQVSWIQKYILHDLKQFLNACTCRCHLHNLPSLTLQQ